MSQTTTGSELDRAGRVAVASTMAASGDLSSRIKDKASEIGASAGEALHSGRIAAADSLDSASQGLHANADSLGRAAHSAADSVSRVGHQAADKIDATAQYVRSHSAKALVADIENFVKENPGKSLLAAVVLGFVVGRVIKSID